MQQTKHKKTSIFYFSSTGNSLIVAKRLSEQIENSEMISIPKVINNIWNYSSNRIIIIFPVYMWGLPNIIIKFINKLSVSETSDIYAIATNAGLAGDPFKEANIILKTKNKKLSGGYLVWMPENFTPKYGRWPNLLENIVLKKSEKKINKIIVKIKNGEINHFEKSFIGINGFLGKIREVYITKLFKEKSLLPKDYFFVSEDCNGCRICEKVCPVWNIKVKNKIPEWDINCELCMACYQWCPQKAIDFTYFGKKTKKRYHHPKVSVNDFIINK